MGFLLILSLRGLTNTNHFPISYVISLTMDLTLIGVNFDWSQYNSMWKCLDCWTLLTKSKDVVVGNNLKEDHRTAV